MRLPSEAAIENLIRVIGGGSPDRAEYISQLTAGGYSMVAPTEVRDDWVEHLVLKAGNEGLLDADLLTLLEDLQPGRRPDFDEIRILLEFQDFGEGRKTLGPKELEGVKVLALKAGLHQPGVFEELEASLPEEHLRHAARLEPPDSAEQVRAWLDAANRQRVEGNDLNWFVEFVRVASELDGVAPKPLDTLRRRLALRGLGQELGHRAENGSLEAVLVEGQVQVDGGTFRRRWSKAEDRICAVFTAANEGVGTGFLVGPDLVLTCWHVAKLLAGNPGGAKLTFAFAQEAESRDAALAAAWLVDYTEPTSEEANSRDLVTPPNADELDHALLRLATPLGDEVGWFDLAAQRTYPFPEGDSLMILGHPEEKVTRELRPQIWALEPESVIERLHEGRRVRYRTNTHHGSSGSPVFTLDWQVVALHHYGSKQQGINQGIPVGALVARAQIAAELPTAGLRPAGPPRSASPVAAPLHPVDDLLFDGGAFANRDRFRNLLRRMTGQSRRLLLIDGAESSGKSHAAQFVQHVVRSLQQKAVYVDLRRWDDHVEPVGATARRVVGYIAEQVRTDAGYVLGTNQEGTSDTTKLKEIDSVATRLTHALAEGEQPCWLIIDHLERSTRDEVKQLVRWLSLEALNRQGMRVVVLTRDLSKNDAFGKKQGQAQRIKVEALSDEEPLIFFQQLKERQGWIHLSDQDLEHAAATAADRHANVDADTPLCWALVDVANVLDEGVNLVD